MTRIFCIASLLLLSISASAASIFRIELDKDKVRVGEFFSLQLHAEGGSLGDAKVPEVDGLEITTRQGTYQGRSISIVNGVISHTRTFEQVYLIRATRAGTFTIPPFEMEIDDAVQKSNSVTIEVVAAGATPPKDDSQGDVSRSHNAQLDWDDLVLTTSDVDKRAAYENEPIHLTLSLWRIDQEGIQVGSMRGAQMEYPSKEGFYAGDMLPTTTRKTKGEWNYEVNQYHQMLYPTVTGELTIGPWHWEGLARANTSYGPRQHQYELTTEPITITVKPLPTPPPNFSGAVGAFTVSGNLARQDVLQGVPVRLFVVVQGNGNPDAIKPPNLAAIPDTYITEAEDEVKSIGQPESPLIEKKFTYSVTSLHAGTVPIPAIEFCYFNPQKETFETATVGPFTLTVQPAQGQRDRIVADNDAQQTSSAIEILDEDLMPIITEAGPLSRNAVTPLTTTAFVATPPVVYALFALFLTRKRRLETDSEFARSHYARSKSHKRLAMVANTKDPAEQLYKALVGYIGDKFNLHDASMTSSDIRDLLDGRGVDSELTFNIARILTACERVRYSSGSLSTPEIGALIQAAETAMDALDEFLRTKQKS